MLEDLTVIAARTLVQFFWLIILFILIFGTIWIKSGSHAEEH